MAASYSSDPGRSDKPAVAVRLDGWKDIAAYLGKAERTVKRWEGQRGLPIHRVPGGAKASVYALPIELDQWLASSAIADSEPVVSVAASDPEVIAEPAAIAPEFSVRSSSLDAPPTSFTRFPRLRWVTAILAAGGLGTGMVVAMVSSATGIPLRERVQAIIGKKRPDPSAAVSDPERKLARDLYLQGRYEWNQRTPGSLDRALDLFTQAIVHDPGYAQAYAGLADTYDLLREYSTMPENDAFPRAIAAARKAVELDDSLAEAHRALAFAEMYGSWDFEDAEKEFRRAIELDPNDAQARRWYANAFAVSGRFEDSLEQLNRAQELDPASDVTLADKGILLANAGRTQEAIELLKVVERSAPEFSSPHLYMSRITLDAGDYPTFIAEAEKAAETMDDPVMKEIVASARMGFASGDGPGMLKSLYEKQKEYYLAGKLDGTTLAETCILMGKRQEALDLLDTAYARHETEVLAILSHPGLRTMKDEPRYQALLAKIHFPMRPAITRPLDSAERDNPHLAILNGLR
jgi:tetratricopeptide (TPR) repeat protein